MLYVDTITRIGRIWVFKQKHGPKDTHIHSENHTMGRFTRHQYCFSRAMAKNWFALLTKFYVGVAVEVQVEGATELVKGNVSAHFFATLPDAESYTVRTEHIWTGHEVVQVMPAFTAQDFAPYLETHLAARDNLEREATDALTESINDFLGYSSFQCGHEQGILVPDFDEPVPFARILAALALIDPKLDVTHVGVDTEKQRVLLVVKGCRAALIKCKRMGQNIVPTFDLDDGFKGTCPQDWHAQFKTWRQRFDASNGDTWNDPILRSEPMQSL